MPTKTPQEIRDLSWVALTESLDAAQQHNPDTGLSANPEMALLLREERVARQREVEGHTKQFALPVRDGLVLPVYTTQDPHPLAAPQGSKRILDQFTLLAPLDTKFGEFFRLPVFMVKTGVMREFNGLECEAHFDALFNSREAAEMFIAGMREVVKSQDSDHHVACEDQDDDQSSPAPRPV